MADNDTSELIGQFNEELRAAVEETDRYTPIGVKSLLERLKQLNGLDIAKEALSKRDVSIRGDFVLPAIGSYFLAAMRIGRPQLTIEQIVVDRRWRELFSEEERLEAERRLTIYGSMEDLEPRQLPKFSSLWVELRGRGVRPGTRLVENLDNDCKLAGWVAAKSEFLDQPLVDANVRAHLGNCNLCRTRYSDLADRYQRFDQDFLDLWNQLIQYLEAVCKLDEVSLERFLSFQRGDFVAEGIDDESADINFEVMREAELEQIAKIAYWRALRLGDYIGTAMNDFASKFASPLDVWQSWWEADGTDLYSRFIRAAGANRFALALQARKIADLGLRGTSSDTVFWIPDDEGLSSIPGVLWIEQSTDIEDWSEIQDHPPNGADVISLFRLTHQAARAEFAQEQQEALEVAQLRGMNWEWTTDKCTGFLSEKLPDVWPELEDLSRSFLISGQQLLNMPGLAMPSLVVSAWSQAFECELRKRIVVPLHRKLVEITGRVRPATLPGRPPGYSIWCSEWQIDQYTLEKIVRLLDGLNPVYFKDFERLGYNRRRLIAAIRVVKEPRNKASHAREMTRSEVLKILEAFFSFKGLPGGVFATLCPPRRRE